MTTKKTEEKIVEEAVEEIVEEEVEAVVEEAVEEVSAESETSKLEDELTIISELPTKNIKKTPVPLEDNDTKVLKWYNSRESGQYYTLEEASEELDIDTQELKNIFLRLINRCLPKTLDHITDYPEIK